jgi:hypothetical protein
MLQFLVDGLEFWADSKYYLGTLFLGHLDVAQAHLTDVVDYIQTTYQYLAVDGTAVGQQCRRNCATGIGFQLFGQATHVVGEFADFVVEAVYLGGVADDVAKRIQIVVVESLILGRGIHFLLNPDMSGGLQCHRFLLTFQFRLRFLGVDDNHSGECRVGLRLHLAEANGHEQQNKYFPHNHLIDFAARRQRE